MKRVLKRAILATLLLSFFGCGEKKDEVRIYMWGGSKEINQFMDNKVIPYIEKKDNVEVKRVPFNNIHDIVQKLILEKKNNKKDGDIDILWVNGENFKALKEAGVLQGDILSKIKNKDLFKQGTTDKDFGVNIDGYEVPFGEAQFNFISTTVKPFDDYKTLMEYVKKNPGKFTYPTISDFTGSAFVRNLAIDMLGCDNIEKMTPEQLKANLTPVWKYLNDIKPYLWKNGKTYPESEGKLDMLYSKGDVAVAMGYNINKVNSKINSGEFSKDSKSFLFKKGTLYNNHYLTIPENSKNKENAIKVINELTSPEVQAMKQDSKNWGDFTVLDIEKLPKDQQSKFMAQETNDKVPTIVELQNLRVKELDPEKLKVIEEGWRENVEKNR